MSYLNESTQALQYKAVMTLRISYPIVFIIAFKIRPRNRSFFEATYEALLGRFKLEYQGIYNST